MRIFTLFFLFLFCKLTKAQTFLMAEGNKVAFVSYGLFNPLRSFEGSKFNTLSQEKANVAGTSTLQLGYEKAQTDVFSWGLSAYFYQVNVAESAEDFLSVYNNSIKGTVAALQMRATYAYILGNYFRLYGFAAAGPKFRQLERSLRDDNIARQFSSANYADIRKTNFAPVSIELGIGSRFSFGHKVGMQIEAGILRSWVRAGLYYQFIHKGYQNQGKIGF